MSIFSDNARILWEYGYSVIPVKPGSKRTSVKDWSKWCDKKQTEDEINSLIKKYPNHNIALCCGSASGVIFFDYDYIGDDSKIYSETIKNLLPPTPLKRFGSKGFCYGYKYEHINYPFKKLQKKGEQFAEILCGGRYIVIPPSLHPNGNRYKWTDGHDLLSIKEKEIELQPIPFEIYKEIEKLCNYEKPDVKSGRNNALFTYGLKTVKNCQSKDEFKNKLLNYDLKNHKNNPYFSDKKDFPFKNQSEAVNYFADHIIKWVEKRDKWAFGEADGSLFSKMSRFFDKEYPTARRCMLLGDVLYKDKDDWINVLNEVGVIRSMALDYNLPHSKSEDALKRWIKHKKKELLIDLPTWDGRDRFSEISKFLKVKNVSQHTMKEIFKEWGANVFRRIDNHYQQNWLLILNGGQGIGKDTLIQEMFGGLDLYFSNIKLNDTEQNISMKTAHSIICNVAEFDRTSKMSVSTLKDIITRDSEYVRFPYDRAAKFVKYRCSFIASCNVDDILRDPTGNRRYVIFEIEKLSWDYEKGQSLQYLAQMKHMAAQNYKASDKSRSEMSEYIQSKTPDDPDIIMMDDFQERMSLLYHGKYGQHGVGEEKELKAYECAPMVKDLAIQHGMSVRKVQSIIKTKGMSFRRGGNIYYKVDHFRTLRLIKQDEVRPAQDDK